MKKRYDHNVIVIGAGSGGLVAAYIAAAVQAKVALIETKKMGGDCLNTGCVPSKALIRSAAVYNLIKRSEEFGCTVSEAQVDFAAVMRRVQRIIADIAPHDSVERYSQLGVECIQGYALVRSPHSVEVNGQLMTARAIIIAAGARPIVPQLPGLKAAHYVTSDTIWDINELPKKLVVVGGGPIGCELAQALHRLGARVTIVQRPKRILPKEDEDVSATITAQLQKEGIAVLTEHRALQCQDNQLICHSSEGEVRIAFDRLLFALGRSANIKDYGLEALGVRVNARGTLDANRFLQTTIPSIYVCGDVTGPYQFTHAAAHQAWYASVNALFAPYKKFKADYRVIPWSTFTSPEVARVGLSETEATAQGIAYEVTRYGIDDLDRAITDGDAQGFVKVLTPPGKDTILGVVIVGVHAGDLLAEFVLAMKHRIGLNKILSTIHIYPTLAEANKYAAGVWRKNHTPQWLLKILRRFHAWRR